MRVSPDRLPEAGRFSNRELGLLSGLVPGLSFPGATQEPRNLSNPGTYFEIPLRRGALPLPLAGWLLASCGTVTVTVSTVRLPEASMHSTQTV